MLKICLSILLFCICTSGFTQKYSVDNGHAEVQGKTSFTSYTGVSNALKGTVDLRTKTVRFEILLETIDTDNNLRNKDMYKVLETSRYPKAEFSGKIISAFDDKKRGSQLVKVKGDFTIHGQTRALEVNTTLTPADNGIRFFATWPLEISNFGIKRPSVFFIKTDDKHIITIKGTLQRKQ